MPDTLEVDSALEIKNELFCQALIKHHGNTSKAYKEIYPDTSDKLIYHYGWKKIQDLRIQDRLKELLTQQGVGVVRLNALLARKLQAQRPIQIDKEKTVMYVDDNITQMDAIKVGYKLHGLIKENVIDGAIDNSQNLIINTNIDQSKINLAIERLDKLTGKLFSDDKQQAKFVDYVPVDETLVEKAHSIEHNSTINNTDIKHSESISDEKQIISDGEVIESK